MAKTNKESNKLTTKRLSIQINLSGLSFCVFDVSSNTIITFKQFKKDRSLTPLELLDYLKFVIDTEHLKENIFEQILVIYRNDLSTLVPKAFFNEDNLADYLKFNNKILPTDYISYDELNNESMNVYVPLVNINNHIYDTFGEFTYKHFKTVLIDYILNKKTDSGNQMFVYVEDLLFELVIINNNKLIFSNTFSYTTKEDFIYYILFTAEQLQMNPERFPLIFMGDITETSELFEIAYKYVRNVEIENVSPNFNIKPEIKGFKSNLTLLNSF